MSDWRSKSYDGLRGDQEQEHTYVSWINPGAGLPQPGFFLPLDQEKVEVRIPGEVVIRVQRSGGSTEGIYTPVLDLVPLADRFRWEKGSGDSKQYATGKYKDLPHSGKGWHGRTHVLALVRDVEGKVAGPMLLTFKGWAGSFFLEAAKEHAAAVKEALKTAGEDQSIPPTIFFGRFLAGETEMVGSGDQSPVARAAYESIPLDDAWIGEEAVGMLETQQEFFRTWAAAFRNGNGNDHGDSQRVDPNGDATEAQWRTIRGLMSGLGYDDETKQGAALASKGYDPQTLTGAQAEAVIKRLKTASAANGK